MGFYNTFAGIVKDSEYVLSTIPETREVAAIQGNMFTGFQFHPESILSRNGYTILEEAIQKLLQPALQ